MPDSYPGSQRLHRTMAWGVVLTVGAVALRELVRPREGRARFVDWDQVEELALRRCGESRDVRSDPAEQSVYRSIQEEIAPLLDQTLGPVPGAGGNGYPVLQAVGRRDWVRVNVRIFRELFKPLERVADLLPGSLLLDFSQRSLSQYLGLLLGLMARRVLGQYDPALLGREPVETSSLVLVEPNVQAWAAKEALPVDELRRWLAMHEMTHAWQFRAHPWLKDYLEGLIGQVLIGRLADGHRPTPFEVLRTLTVGMGPQWKAISKLQAAMTLLEGFSNLLMDEIGARQLPHHDLLERAYHRRLEDRPPLERLFLRLSGLEMKIQQYIQGERFCRGVRAEGGIELLVRAFEGPASLPLKAEIQRPELWVARIRQAAA